MSIVNLIEAVQVRSVLEPLLGRDIDLEPDSVTPHPATLRGLVTTPDDQLIGVIGSDLPFAHVSGAALGLLPAIVAQEAGDTPAEHLILNYHEIANVLSRVANEASEPRMRIDPGITHDPTDLADLVASAPSTGYHVTISGYGDGRMGYWISDHLPTR